MKEIELVVAIGLDGAIGCENDLPWRHAGDMQHFRELTSGGVVIMGRNTWESIPERFKPLKGRINIVVSRTLKQEDMSEGVVVVDSVHKAVDSTRAWPVEGRRIFVMGGAQIYQAMLPYATRLHITHIEHETPEADCHWPKDASLSVGYWQAADMRRLTSKSEEPGALYVQYVRRS